MRYTMTLTEEVFAELQEHLIKTSEEAAGYLYASLSVSSEETRILVREFLPVAQEAIESRSHVHLSINSRSYVDAIKRSRIGKTAFGFLHSHPDGPASFSAQDDREESGLFQLVHERNPQPVHFSLVLFGKNVVGRVWLPDGQSVKIHMIRVLGNRWRFLSTSFKDNTPEEYFDRQILAFGSEMQDVLGKLHIGLVGAGGTGSAVFEQIVRLGVGTITVIDDDRFARSNVNRVFGSSVFDEGSGKALMLKRLAAHIGLGTNVRCISQNLSFKSVAQMLKSADVIFGCTDDEWGRSILSRIAIYYAIPVLDMAVIIDPDGDHIRSIQGRVTILFPGTACLYCRERITSGKVTAESISATEPDRAQELRNEGYIAGVDAPAPAVVSFTSAVAAGAVAEMLARLTGYKGTDRRPTELLYRFDQDGIGKNTRPSKPDCFCSDRKCWGAGDKRPFLGITWRAEE